MDILEVIDLTMRALHFYPDINVSLHPFPRRILEEKRSILETLAQLLPEKEMASGKEIQELVHKQEQMR